MGTWRVPSSAKGEKLVTFLKNQLGESFSGRRLKLAIEANLCRINGTVERHASARLRGGETVHFELPIDTQSRPLTIENIPILFEDEALIIYDKPSGMVSDDSFCTESTMELVNRLDRGTTGLIVVAKSKQVLDAMISQYKDRTVKKEYLAIVDGIMQKDQGVVENHLGKLHEYEGQALWGAVSEGGVQAITRWWCLERGKGVSLVKCEPVTGKTHQLRVHLLEMGHPVIGDYQYGRKKIRSTYAAKRVLLHAHRLRFKHPLSESWIDVEAPIPEDFSSAQKVLFS